MKEELIIILVLYKKISVSAKILQGGAEKS